MLSLTLEAVGHYHLAQWVKESQVKSQLNLSPPELSNMTHVS